MYPLWVMLLRNLTSLCRAEKKRYQRPMDPDARRKDMETNQFHRARGQMLTKNNLTAPARQHALKTKRAAVVRNRERSIQKERTVRLEFQQARTAPASWRLSCPSSWLTLVRFTLAQPTEPKPKKLKVGMLRPVAVIKPKGAGADAVAPEKAPDGGKAGEDVQGETAGAQRQGGDVAGIVGLGALADYGSDSETSL